MKSVCGWCSVLSPASFTVWFSILNNLCSTRLGTEANSGTSESKSSRDRRDRAQAAVESWSLPFLGLCNISKIAKGGQSALNSLSCFLQDGAACSCLPVCRPPCLFSFANVVLKTGNFLCRAKSTICTEFYGDVTHEQHSGSGVFGSVQIIQSS